MDNTPSKICQLQQQERALAEEIAQLEATADASSTAGIREFRRTRVRQLEDQRVALAHRLRRLDEAPIPDVEAHLLDAAFREATLIAQGTFGR